MNRTLFSILAGLAGIVSFPAGASASPGSTSWSCLDEGGPGLQGERESLIEDARGGSPAGDLSVTGPAVPRASVDRGVILPETGNCLLEVRWDEVVAQAQSETVSLGASAGAGASADPDSDAEPPICDSGGARCTSVPVDLPPPAVAWTLVKGDRGKAVGGQRAARAERFAAPRVIGGPQRGHPRGPFEPPRGERA